MTRPSAVEGLLDEALTRWWANGELPPPWLLRDGLLALEAGLALGEAQRSLLLRAALAWGKGIVTALKHQTDDERTVLLLHEALTAWSPPLNAAYLVAIARAPDQSWHAGLTAALQHTAVANPDPSQRTNAADALRDLDRPTSRPAAEDSARGAVGRKIWLRRGLLVVLLLLVAGLFWRRQAVTAPTDMVAVPGGSYWQRMDDGRGGIETMQVTVEAFFIDRFEVTSGDYRRCVAAGTCAPPARFGSATRTNYFTDRGFAAFPVVHVSQAQAAAYCTWRGKRLPTQAEWQAAAGNGVGTEPLTYPWGEQYAPQWANGAAGGVGDTLAVGAFQPAGNSWVGVVDAAGNVAEWTATTGAETGSYVVKGGSFRSDAAGLMVHHAEQIPGATTADWLGFRCARARVPGR
jgi:formylglycine-generating enzyme required for sulfatase activity